MAGRETGRRVLFSWIIIRHHLQSNSLSWCIQSWLKPRTHRDARSTEIGRGSLHLTLCTISMKKVKSGPFVLFCETCLIMKSSRTRNSLWQKLDLPICHVVLLGRFGFRRRRAPRSSDLGRHQRSTTAQHSLLGKATWRILSGWNLDHRLLLSQSKYDREL